MRRLGRVTVVVVVVGISAFVAVRGKTADFEDKEENFSGSLKNNDELSKDTNGRELRFAIRVIQRTADSRHALEILNRTQGFDEFNKKIYFEKGTESQQIPTREGHVNNFQLKKIGLNKFMKYDIEHSIGTSQKIVTVDKIRQKREDVIGIRIKKEVDEKKVKSKSKRFRQLSTKEEDLNKIDVKKDGLKSKRKGKTHERENLKIENYKGIRIKRSPNQDYPKESVNVKSIVITKEVTVPYPVRVTKLVPRPVRVEVERPVQVRVPKPVPVRVERVVRYPVKKRVPVPYPVVKEVPVFIRHHVVRPRPVRVVKPFPVIVERKVPIPVVRKVLHPVRVRVRVQVPVLKPLVSYVFYPVHKTVLYPVKVPVRKPVPYPVVRPYPVVVEKKVPYPVVKHVPYPVPEAVKSNDGYSTQNGLGSEDGYDYN